MEYEHEPTLRDLIDLLRRGLLDALVVAIVAAVATYLISGTQTPIYEAEASVLAASQDPNGQNFGTSLVTAPPLDAGAYRSAITSRPVLGAAYEAVTGTRATAEALEDLEEATTVRSEDANRSSILRILVENEDPALARDLANALADGIVAWDVDRATRSLETIVESLEAQIAGIDAELATYEAQPELAAPATVSGLERTRTDLALQLASARALRTAAVGRIELLEPAIAPLEPVRPRPIRNAALAAVLAVFLVYGLRLLRDALDTRVRDVDDLARLSELPVLAEYPAVKQGRRALPREATSYLRTSIDFATTDAHPKILMVTSTHAAHGKSSVAMSLAESYARQGHRVLLLGADLRKPVLASEYGLKPGTVQTVREALDDPQAAAPTRVELKRNLAIDVLDDFAASPSPTERLGRGVRPLLDRLSPEYDVIVIDTAPIVPVADALGIAPFTTGVILAVSLPDADRRAVRSAVELLGRLNVPILGAVATNMKPGDRTSASGYGYGYGYGYGGRRERGTAR